ncbi:MAG: ABC transporter ATP-binding protein [Deltaproteobacteria bacterium]|nr:ABC transporter ATP-binding protein [Deltaproteobacteria bacterium]
MVEMSGISLTYQTESGPHPALVGIDLTVRRGQSCVIIGPTGCGKTSLLHILAGLVVPTQGQASINGELVRKPRRETSLILQQHGLFPWKNAISNVTIGLAMRGVPKIQQRNRARKLMEKLGIWDVKDSFPGQLSGGQQQRVAIARAVTTDPDLLLMDEPFSSLDAMTRESLQNLLLRIWNERLFTYILVTHSIEEAVFLGRKVVVLSPRPGSVAHTLENPGVGGKSFRLSGEFRRKCLQVRRMVEEAL